MATDPYHAVQQEIQTSLQTAGQLRASYVRIKNMAREDSEELGWARSELKATLAALEADLEDLEDSVKIVETTGPRMFGLEESEVQERKRYVAYVRKEVESMRAELNTERSGTSQNLSSYSASSQSHSGQNTPRLESERGLDGDHQEAWAREEQQLMIREQDRTMESIAGTLSTLAQQAGLMGQEIGEHNEMLDDLESGVDRTDNKLSDAMRKMRKFARKSEERGSGWCVVILIVVLMILLLVAILI
ncbi:syntaxin 6, N-terminal-domain-containing protein [Lentinula boryana]|uniref:Syntaxin 6, N-terminal-domain-containing protein n=1 Tax=Lentinula boryana TaxID=40481 RepID=A0ABQ8Q0S3_9AGAR|nr:syntaxin 6, N-terminal-domain-containing protein [Lentinula boryana]